LDIYTQFKKKWNDAIKYFNQVLSLDPNNYMSIYNLIVAYNTIGDLERAEAEYKRLKNINPQLASKFSDLFEVAQENK